MLIYVIMTLSALVAVLSVAAIGVGVSAIIKYCRLKKDYPALTSVMYSLMGQDGPADMNIEPQYLNSITRMFKMHKVALRLFQGICILIGLALFSAMVNSPRCKMTLVCSCVCVVGAVVYSVASRRVRRVDGALKRLSQLSENP